MKLSPSSRTQGGAVRDGLWLMAWIALDLLGRIRWGEYSGTETIPLIGSGTEDDPYHNSNGQRICFLKFGTRNSG